MSASELHRELDNAIAVRLQMPTDTKINDGVALIMQSHATTDRAIAATVMHMNIKEGDYVACSRCHATGVARWKNSRGNPGSGECFACNGKGYQDKKDIRRNHDYWAMRRSR